MDRHVDQLTSALQNAEEEDFYIQVLSSAEILHTAPYPEKGGGSFI